MAMLNNQRVCPSPTDIYSPWWNGMQVPEKQASSFSGGLFDAEAPGDPRGPQGTWSISHISWLVVWNMFFFPYGDGSKPWLVPSEPQNSW